MKHLSDTGVDPIEPALARRRRARLASHYPSSVRLPRALADRLVEHLEPIRREPHRILELGAATGELRARLRTRYPHSQLVSADDCPALLQSDRPRWWPRRQSNLLCTTAASLPVASRSIDMLVCTLDLLRVDDLDATLREWRRVLRHDALIMLATLGPLSFNELVTAWNEVDTWPHLHRFPDMHELGDALVRAGFSDVVMDSERLQMEFDNLSHLLREMRIVGGGNALTRQRRSLTTPRTLERVERHYRDLAPGTGCRATIEAVFAHGWVVDRGGVSVAPPTKP